MRWGIWLQSLRCTAKRCGSLVGRFYLLGSNFNLVAINVDYTISSCGSCSSLGSGCCSTTGASCQKRKCLRPHKNKQCSIAEKPSQKNIEVHWHILYDGIHELVHNIFNKNNIGMMMTMIPEWVFVYLCTLEYSRSILWNYDSAIMHKLTWISIIIKV